MSIAVTCPTCSHAGKVPDSFASQAIRCPKCKAKFRVPAVDGDATVALDPGTITVPPASSRPAPAPAAEPQARCPYCSEPIQAAAKKCKHCGEWLDESMRPDKAQSIQAAPAPPSPANPFAFEDAGSGPDHAPPVVLHEVEDSGFRCPFCKSTMRPRVDQKISTAGWVVFLLLLILFCWPLCWVGFLMREDYRVCSSCGIKLG